MYFHLVTCLLLWPFIAIMSASQVECPLFFLQQFESSVYSQNGEDGIILALLSIIGSTDRKYVEFGVENGDQCNTRLLREQHNFTGLLMDGGFENEFINLRREFLTVDNIVELFQKYNVPSKFDLLSIDLDMFDFWILEKVLKVYVPRIIIAEVNPTLGHNIRRQSHKHFMQTFRDLNSMPLVVNHPYTMDQQGWDGTRYSGANPLALQLLTKEFGYEMVYCESCGVNCFFVLKSLIPSSCPEVFPTPGIHYPCYGTGELEGILGHKSDPLMRNPVLLSPSLVRQIVEGGRGMASLIAENFSSHLLRLDKRLYMDIDRNEVQLSSGGSGDESDLSCDCLAKANTTCTSPDDVIRSTLEVFQSYFDMYNFVTQPRMSNRKRSKVFPSYVWTCHLLHNLKSSTICLDLAALYFRKSLHLLQRNAMDEARKTATLGLKFSARSKLLLHLMNYFHLHDFIMASQAETYSLSFIELLQNDEVKVIGMGVGVCDNIPHRIQHHRVLASHHLAIFERIARKALQQLFGGFLHVDDGYTHTPKHISIHNFAVGSYGPYHHSSDFFSTNFIHSCFRHNIFKIINENIDQVCKKRNEFETILIFSPPFSGSGNMKRLTAAPTLFPDTDTNLSHLNAFILQSLGCEGSASGVSWSPHCKQSLQELTTGFLPQAITESNRSLWFNISQSIYKGRLGNKSRHLVLSDPIFSFTSLIWKEPLGTTLAVIPLSSPAFAINCLSKTENIPRERALSYYLFYFYAMMESVKGHENVLFVKYDPNTNLTINSTYFSRSTISSDAVQETLEFFTYYSVCHDYDSASDQNEEKDSVPSWLQECIDAAVRDNSATACTLEF